MHKCCFMMLLTDAEKENKINTCTKFIPCVAPKAHLILLYTALSRGHFLLQAFFKGSVIGLNHKMCIPF